MARNSPSRRGFLGSLIGVPAGFALAAGAVARAQAPYPADPAASPATTAAPAAPDCPADDGGSMRTSLNYLAVSPHGPARDCRNCELWLVPQGGAACGGCTLISGAISPVGYCDSWALAAGAAAPAQAAPTPNSATPSDGTNG